jgi:hypothetical protein
MSHWKIDYVEQVGSTCTVACLAMIRGLSFEDPTALTLGICADYLGDHGYEVLIKEVLYHSDPKFARDVISTPFAPAHIVHCKQYAENTIQHVVVMDAKGEIFNPAAKERNSLDEYYMLTGVLGIWKK